MRDLPRLYDIADARRIGKGGYASVFEGARRADGVAVAVKRVDTTGHSAKKRERCARELNLCASLPRHDNVVFLLDAFASEDALVMIFPLARGGDLRGAIRRRRRARERFRARDVWTIFRGVARGLAHLHARGIAHRDVKPANVLLGDCDSSSSSSSSFADVKLADLGLAVRVPDADDARPLRSKVGGTDSPRTCGAWGVCCTSSRRRGRRSTKKVSTEVEGRRTTRGGVTARMGTLRRRKRG
jgi:NIMA (never in mitosis gene a)-related kinase